MVDQRYKLIRFYGPDVPNGEEWELYDLETDPNEMNNIYGSLEQRDNITQKCCYIRSSFAWHEAILRLVNRG